MNSQNSVTIGDAYVPQDGPQRAFHASAARYPLGEGGRGGGKTTALMWEAIKECLTVPGCNVLLLRRTLTAVEKGGIEDHFVKYVPPRFYKSHNRSKHIVKFHNGSTLFFGHIRTDADLAQYQGAEFLFIGWEELTQFTYTQWDFMKGSNRCPIKTYMIDGKTYRVKPRMAGVTNPNGKGSGWVKALWITKKPPAGMAILDYDPSEYEAIHSTFRDNKVYANDKDYISLLNSISDPVLRAAWIPGSWSILAGQFFQNWEGEFDDKTKKYVGRHVKSPKDVTFTEWDDRWIAIDWGFEHATAVLWFARVMVPSLIDPTERRSIVICYRQLITRRKNEELLAEMIVNENHTGDRFDKIARIFLSPDRFSKINQEHSIADTMGDVFVRYDMPRPERANNARVDGWRLMYTMLDTESFAVMDTCRDVIESIPKLMRDDKDPEDAESAGNDLYLDVCEACRYGLMGYANESAIPQQVRDDERIKSIKDPTAKYLEYLRIIARPTSAEGMVVMPGAGRNWRNQ